MDIFDLHQDISDTLLYTCHSDFWKKNRLNEGNNDFGLHVNNQTDFVRLEEGGVRLVFGVSCAISFNTDGNPLPHKDHFRETLRHIDLYHNLQSQRPNEISFIRFKENLKRTNEHRLNVLLAIEGADGIGDNLNELQTFYDRGVRSIGLTWSNKNALAGGCNEDGSLTLLGRKVIEQMDKLGVLLDLSHIGTTSFFEALEAGSRPVVVSHTACQSVHNHPRNITDDQIRAVTQKGGVIGICGVSGFVGDPNIDKLIDHIMHVVDLVGIDFVGIGSDFGGMLSEKLIDGFCETNHFPNLVSSLGRRGFNKEDIEKVMHKNIERVLEETLPER